MNFITESVTVKESRYEPNAVLTEHIHKNPHFCTILRGGYSGKYGSKFQEGHPGETAYRPASETHTVRFHDVETRILIIEFSPSLSRWASQHCRGLDVSSSFARGRLTWLAKQLWFQHRLQDSCSQLAVDGLLLEMLAEISRLVVPSAGRVPQWLLQVKAHIEETFVESLSLEALAKVADVHPVYLVTAFKKAFRSTPGEFQRQMRVRKAEELIVKKPALTLSEIALEMGFFDQSHFSRAFKQVTSLTPSTFRQSLLDAGGCSRRLGSYSDPSQ
jgi:AraC family transcriptional regulator